MSDDSTQAKGSRRKYSAQVVDGVERAPSRAMLRAVGFSSAAFKRPQVGIASTWAMVTPCNMHIDGLAKEAARGVDAAGGKAVPFGTISISDGISMGTEGMKYSLVSREVIADSIELVARGHLFDGLVCLVGCDKTIPAAVMALFRLDLPGLVLYNGSIPPGRVRGRDGPIQGAF